MTIQWSEPQIGAYLVRTLFQRKFVAVVDNCNWTGHECDLLCVTPQLHIVDVEIKISRADLKADGIKEKWWHRQFAGYGQVEEKYDEHGRLLWSKREPLYNSTARLHPPKVWKHYYALPATIWKPELLDCLPSDKSGVILLHERDYGGIYHSIARRSKPNNEAPKITPEVVNNIARLATLRLWDAYDRVRQAQDDAEHWRKQVAA